MNDKLRIFAILTMFMLPGCATFLPSSKDVVRTPWNNYQEVKESFNKVTTKETTVRQLKTFGFDIYSTPNVRILNYIDIAVATQSIKSDDLEGGLRDCIKAQNGCRGYEFEPRVIKSERHGNFWLDIFNFRRKTRGTGWKFKAVFLIVDDIVIEKLWSGDPRILEERETKNPLGPLQDAGGMILKLIP